MNNQTPFATQIFLFPDEEGIDTLYVAVKATFELSPGPVIAAEQRPVTVADEYWGKPGQSSLKYATEAHLQKPGTDVAVVGDALTPQGSPMTELDVSLSVADRSGTIRVFGDRRWQGTGLKAWPGRPAPFYRIPLRYELAYGGMQVIENPEGPDEIHVEPYNPVGRGLRGKRSFGEMQQEPVPNLEDPTAPITSWKSKSMPVGFGFVAPWWAPRMALAGTYDEKWQKTRAPYLPDDFDVRFFNSASRGWVFEQGLRGGEPVAVENMSPTGRLAFEVPAREFSIDVTVAGKVETPDPHLETVLLEPNDERLCLTWRASVRCDKKALEVSEVRIR